jgi:hypothetical protein
VIDQARNGRQQLTKQKSTALSRWKSLKQQRRSSAGKRPVAINIIEQYSTPAERRSWKSFRLHFANLMTCSLHSNKAVFRAAPEFRQNPRDMLA